MIRVVVPSGVHFNDGAGVARPETCQPRAVGKRTDLRAAEGLDAANSAAAAATGRRPHGHQRRHSPLRVSLGRKLNESNDSLLIILSC